MIPLLYCDHCGQKFNKTNWRPIYFSCCKITICNECHEARVDINNGICEEKDIHYNTIRYAGYHFVSYHKNHSIVKLIDILQTNIIVNKASFIENCIRDIPYFCPSHFNTVIGFNTTINDFVCEKCNQCHDDLLLVDDIIKIKASKIQEFKQKRKEFELYNEICETTIKNISIEELITGHDFIVELEKRLSMPTKPWSNDTKVDICTKITHYLGQYQEKLSKCKPHLEIVISSFKDFECTLADDMRKLAQYNKFKDYIEINLGESFSLNTFNYINSITTLYNNIKKKVEKLKFYKINGFRQILAILKQLPVCEDSDEHLMRTIDRTCCHLVEYRRKRKLVISKFKNYVKLKSLQTLT